MLVTVYYDYSCPYVYRAALWLDEVTEQDATIRIRWRYFSLTQINNKEEGWQVWEEPRHNPKSWTVQRRMRGLRAQWAAEAARQQGQEAFQRYHLALLQAIHEEHLSLDNDEATRHAAQRAELDLDRWMRETQNLELLDTLRRDHEAATELGIFGTPSFVFEGAAPTYLKLRDIPTPEEALSYWTTFQTLSATQPLFLEIKRPH